MSLKALSLRAWSCARALVGKRSSARLCGSRSVPLEHGKLVAEALAARRAGADDDVLAGPKQVVGGALVTVKLFDAGRDQRCAQRGRQVRRQLRRAASSRGLVRDGDHLLVPALAEERAQSPLADGGRSVDAHIAILYLRAGERGIPVTGGTTTEAPRGAPQITAGWRRAITSAMRRPRSRVKNHTSSVHSP